MSGHYRMHRGWMDNPVFGSEAFTRAQAWTWMIEEAAWRDTRVGIAGKSTLLKRGQLSHSLRFLAEKWKWKKDAVARYIARLESETMIATDTATGQQVITICNYDIYQSSPQEDETAGETENATGPRQDRDSSATKKKELKELNKQIPSEIDGDFLEWYAAYPLHVKPKTAEAAYRRARRKTSHAELMAGVVRYRINKPDYADWAQPSSWLNGERWLDEAPPTPPPKAGDTAIALAATAERLKALDAKICPSPMDQAPPLRLVSS